MFIQHVLESGNGTVIWSFVSIEEIPGPEIIYTEFLNLSAVKNTLTVTELDDLEEGDWVKNWLSTSL